MASDTDPNRGSTELPINSTIPYIYKEQFTVLSIYNSMDIDVKLKLTIRLQLSMLERVYLKCLVKRHDCLIWEPT